MNMKPFRHRDFILSPGTARAVSLLPSSVESCIRKSKFNTLLISVIVLLIAGSLTSCSFSSWNDESLFEECAYLAKNDSVGAYAIPNIIATPEGVVLCFATARMGDNHDWGNVQRVVLLRSTDNGETWEDLRTIAAIPDWTVRQSSAVFDPCSRKVFVFGHKSPRFNRQGERITESWNMANREEAGELGAGHFYLVSDDLGETWSEMNDIELPYWPHDPGICLESDPHKGRLILPARLNTGNGFFWDKMFNGVLISDDHGETWRAGGVTQSHVGEGCVVELSDGRIYVSNRNHGDHLGFRTYAVSRDAGETFTEFGYDTVLVEPVCDAGMTRLDDPGKGTVILFSNPAVKAGEEWDGNARRRMSVRASYDDAQTWPVQKLIFPGPSAYSGLAVGKEGMIFLVYERGHKRSTDSRADLAIVRFNLRWLEQEDAAPPVSVPDSLIF